MIPQYRAVDECPVCGDPHQTLEREHDLCASCVDVGWRFVKAWNGYSRKTAPAGSQEAQP